MRMSECATLLTQFRGAVFNRRKFGVDMRRRRTLCVWGASGREESMGLSSDAAHADKVLDVLGGAGCADAALAASWRRSGCLHALDPASRTSSYRLSEVKIANARERLGRLLGIARSGLDRLFLAVSGVGCSVLLADKDGIVVDRRGARADDKTFDAWGLWTGAVWSEKFEGTNG